MTYDVSTETAEGRRRLRRVAHVCEAFGQRVQKSVFECVVSVDELERLKRRLLREADLSEDSLRIYRLQEPRERFVEVFGVRPEFDIREPIIV